jgi:hypothetical protein
MCLVFCHLVSDSSTPQSKGKQKAIDVFMSTLTKMFYFLHLESTSVKWTYVTFYWRQENVILHPCCFPVLPDRQGRGGVVQPVSTARITSELCFVNTKLLCVSNFTQSWPQVRAVLGRRRRGGLRGLLPRAEAEGDGKTSLFIAITM